MREPPQTSVGARDRGGDGLLDFVRQRGGQFSHHVDAVDVRQISLQLPQPFVLFLGALSFGDIHGDADVLTYFLRGIVMP